MTGRDAELKDYRIHLEKGRGRGWGKVSILLDANPADDLYWFALDRPVRRAVVVAEDPRPGGRSNSPPRSHPTRPCT